MINDARCQGNRVIVYPMKPRTPGFWLTVATFGLLALLPMQALAGMHPEEVKAFEGYKAKAEKGDPLAQYRLGLCYESGDGVAKDPVEAVKWFRKATDQGNTQAQTELGRCYFHGKGVPKDWVEAVKWYRKAAEQGYSEGQNELGFCYSNGWGVAVDKVEAAKWFRKAAEQGHLGAKQYLNSLRDPAEVVKEMRIAAEQGDAVTQYKLADCYFYGKGVAENAGRIRGQAVPLVS